MLNDSVKDDIQQAYREFLAGKALQPRYGQKLMIAEIARTIARIKFSSEGARVSDDHVCVVEAGTGTGKTIAYLIPTIVLARALGKQIVIATATVALQEQIVHKDLPELNQHTELNLRFRLAKGRGRYMCLAKLDHLLSEDENSQFIPLYEDEFSALDDQDRGLFKNMLEKLSLGDWDGDRDNWPEEIEHRRWQKITTDHRQCSGRKCSHIRSCSFFKARDAIDDTECVVANHDLVLADLALGGGAILPRPEETIYIFDEGHHLPDKALNHFSSHARYRSAIRWLGQSEGQWPSIVSPLEDASYFMQLAAPMESTLKSVRSILENNLHIIQGICDDIDTSQYSPRLRFSEGRVPEILEHLAKELQEAFSDLVHLLEKLSKELEILLEQDHPLVPKVDLENLYPLIGSWLNRAEMNVALWSDYVDTTPDEKWPIARWITLVEQGESYDFEIVASPILASRALDRSLWQNCYASIVTSATITALKSFDRFKYRAGTNEQASYLSVPSPFDFSENGQLTLPEGAVEANDAQRHTESVIDLLQKIIDLDQGSLVLFSSRKQMLDVYDALPTHFTNHVLLQGNESKQMLLVKHKSRIDGNRGSVLFGLASFAEGVDLPGKYCTHVVIAKIPFAVPDDPVEAALAEWIDATGGNAFMQVSVPDAAMKLIQACGRLLRTETDRGTVSILDRRIISKRYGKMLLESLPPFKRVPPL